MKTLERMLVQQLNLRQKIRVNLADRQVQVINGD
jgi:hypothetical protein